MSKIAESWRSTPSSFTRATRSRTAGSVEPEALAEHREGPGLEREVPLDRVEELAIEVVELVVAGRRGHGHAFIGRAARRAGRGNSASSTRPVRARVRPASGAVAGGPVSVDRRRRLAVAPRPRR